MPTTPARAGDDARQTHRVTADDTAAALGSGTVEVLATPRLLAWLEDATCRAIEPSLGPGEASVGTRVTLEHLKASVVGAEVTAHATVVAVDGRLVRFEAVATDGEGVLLGRAEITRVVVDTARFLARL